MAHWPAMLGTIKQSWRLADCIRHSQPCLALSQNGGRSQVAHGILELCWESCDRCWASSSSASTLDGC